MERVYAGDKRISIGNGCDLVLDKPGSHRYQEGIISYHVEASGVQLDMEDRNETEKRI